jgi:zinc transport system substrate-binding protein
MSLRKLFILSGLVLPLLASPVQALQVVASVKPLQLLSAALLDGISEPRLLVPADASVHNYVLKPSDVRGLAAADLVIWVGPELELFLGKALKNTNARILQLGGADVAASGSESDHDHDHGHDHDSHADESAQGEVHKHAVDAHLWMDPELMLAAAQRMQQMLTQIAPEYGPRLAANYARFAASLQAKDAALRLQLAPLADQGFFVFHDAYGHFVGHYGLKQLGYFTLDPARPPGARRLSDIRRQLKAREAVCVFSEPQFRSNVVSSVTQGLDVRHGELDPLARGFEPGRGDRWHWDGVAFRFLHPAASASYPGHDNDTSCVLEIAVGTERVLLTGDIEAAAEQQLVDRALVQRVTVLVAPHHGSRTSSSAPFVDATRPQLVVFSAGHRNRWGFPLADVEQRWREAGSVTLRTAASGAVLVRVDRSGITHLEEFRRAQRRYWRTS